jgi:hypothetical protein
VAAAQHLVGRAERPGDLPYHRDFPGTGSCPSFGLRFCRRSTETSWRSISNSVSFDAEERASSAIQPVRRTNIG